MNLRIETSGATTLVIPEGRLDFGSAAGFEKELEQALAGTTGPRTSLVIDCAGLEYVSSAGLRSFLLAARGAQRANVQFALCAPQPAVREVLDLCGLSRIMTVHADRATALAHVQPGHA